MSSTVTETQVGIIGGGPAGLMLSHLLARQGIDSVVVEQRTREEIERTHRAGILEKGSVDLLVDAGVTDRVLRDGHRHTGIDLRFNGVNHRVDFERLTGASTWLYPQTDVFTDLARARARDGGDVRFGVSGTTIVEETGDRAGFTFTDADGTRQQVRCDILVGADGSRSTTRDHIGQSRHYRREYPFAWFGILCEAPVSNPVLIYARSPHGFALVSQRTETVQRLYFQCDPADEPQQWSDDRIWSRLHDCLAGDDGYAPLEGPIIDKSVLPFRSFVCEPMVCGRIVLAGDAAHTVPPTGAKGLNLALADVRVLAEELPRAFAGDAEALQRYCDRALQRVWKAQHFSYWMTTMLHSHADGTGFDDRRQLGELETLVASDAGSRYLAEGYTGWPHLPG